MEIIIDNTNAYTKSVEENINVVENATWEKVIKEIVQKIISKKDNLIHVKKILEAKFDIIGELVIVTATAKTELLNHRYFEVAFQLDKNLVWNCNEKQQYVRMFGYKEF